jgi:murein DD-endopeptidase MepM/ murein hydrolase activator NlpD
MRRTRYYYNPRTLQFEKLQKPLKVRIRNGAIYVTVISILFIGVRLLIDRDFTSPKVTYFTQRNLELRHEYQKLDKKINLAETFLYQIQNRDDKVYRSVFNLEPIPPSVREAGFGGSEDYYQDLYSRNTEFVRNTARKLDELSTKARIQSVSLSDIYQKAKDQSLLLERKPSIQPISPADQFWLTSTFGYRWDPFTKRRRMHHGIDLAGPVGLNIYSTGAGVVEVAEFNRHGYGKEIIINHGFGFKSVYAHLDEIHVKVGDTLKKGQLIGKLGDTGRSTGPHLHYEIRKYNQAVNPMYYFYEDLSPDEYAKIIVLNSE